MEYYSAIKKKEFLLFATTCIEFESIMLSEISQKEKDKYCMISVIWNSKKKKKKLNSETENRKVIAKGRRVGEIGRG